MRYGIICSDVSTEFMLCTHVKSQASKTPVLFYRLSAVLCTHVKSQTSRTLPLQSFLSNSLCTYVKSQAAKTYICGLPVVAVLCTYVKSQAARFSNNIDFGEWTNCPHLLAAKSASDIHFYIQYDRFQVGKNYFEKWREYFVQKDVFLNKSSTL